MSASFVADSKQISVYPPNERHLEVRAVADTAAIVLPSWRPETYKNALLTNTNHLYVNGKYQKTGLLKPFDNKMLSFSQEKYLYYKSWLYKVAEYKGEYLLAHDTWSHNYYHWMCEVLPRINVLKGAFPAGRVIVPSALRSLPYVPDSLALLGYDAVYTDEKGYNRFDMVHTIQTDPAIPIVSPAAQSELVEKLKSQAVIADVGQYRKIYIPRSGALKRKIINEAEVIKIVSEFGYEVVSCEEFSFKEQIDLFSRASSIVGIHGAGLTNLMYMPKGSKVLEIRNPFWDMQALCFWNLANAFGIRWDYLLGSGDSIKDQDSDLLVDCEEFALKLEQFEELNNNVV